MLDIWNQLKEDDILLHVVPLQDNMHSAINSPTLLFIKNLCSKKIIWIGLGHPDIASSQSADIKEVVDKLGQIKGKKWVVDKKSFLHMIPVKGLLDVGLVTYFKDNKVLDISEFETTAHDLIRRNFPRMSEFAKLVPFEKHLESFSELSEACEKIIKKAVVDDAFIKFNEMIIEPLAEIERKGLKVNANEFRRHFSGNIFNENMVYTQYFYYTSTGRPSNRYAGINYAALNKDDGSRKSFISRFGKEGQLVLIDYSAFHPRIIAYLTGYDLPRDIDTYEYLAKLYFNKKDIDERDIADAKQITFRQLYGGVEEKYSHIKFLSHLKDFVNHHWKFFNQNGYVETPIFKRKITNKHIQTPKPATVFNYLLQAAEGEISIPILSEINEFLMGKRTQAILYTYDSILFDYNLGDGEMILSCRDIMSMDGRFSSKVHVGNNYQEMYQVA